MSEFEIRILDRDGPSITTTLSVYSTESAIGSAVRLARGRHSTSGRKAAASTRAQPHAPSLAKLIDEG
jgi:hypothetical protein